MKKKVNQHKVELCLTCDCNLSCPNCSHSCSKFPSKDYLSIEKIHHFIDESLRLNYVWHKIALNGGEATLHPHFLEAVDIICGYKNHNKKFFNNFTKNCVIEVVTNGCGEKVNEVLSSISNPCVTIRNDFVRKGHSLQNKLDSHFDFYVAPVDLEEYKNDTFDKGCKYAHMCGVAYTNNGFYPCSVSAHIDRVMGLGLGLPTLEDVRNTNMDMMLRSFCKYCGLYKNDKKNNLDGSPMSQTWKEIYNK
jgi:MoaA/NifB/PqqE/SkfB family radical SAM enzyme